MSDELTNEGRADRSERPRLRRGGMIVAVSAGLGVIGAFASAFRGGTGRDGLVVVLLMAAAGCAIGAIDAAVLMLVDQFRGRTSTWRRLVLVFGLLLGAVVLLAMIGGVADGGA